MTASNGPACSRGRTAKSGLSGISYYAINQWQVASLQPKHLAAICVWEGFADFYRELSHNGGIYNTFAQNWYDMQVKTVQYGLGVNGHRSRMNGDWVSGPETLTDEEMGANRYDLGKTYFAHPLDDDFYKAMLPDWSKVKVPLLSAANWGGQPLHPRGNFEGFIRSASKQKWLEVHGIEHWTHYYTDYGVDLQRKFFGYFLKGEKNGWDKQPRVQLNVRHPGENFVIRHEDAWPLPSTQWTKFHLATDAKNWSTDRRKAPPRSLSTRMGDGVTFLTEPMAEATEITGPVAAKLHVSSSTADADIFLVLRVFAPDMKEVVFQGALDPHTAIGQGWLRASHRKLDKKLSLPFRPYHSHDEKQPLKPGQVYELDIEIIPTCIVVPKGYRVALERARARLCLSRRLRRQALQHEERIHRQRPVPARRPARPPAGDLWRQDHAASRRRAGELSCCCRSFRRKAAQQKRKAARRRKKRKKASGKPKFRA